MALTPLDLQTNMNQSIEVARTQKAHDDAITIQQQFLDKESHEKGITVNSKVQRSQENQEIFKQEEFGQKEGRTKHKKDKNDKSLPAKTMKTEFVEDDRVGGIIDIRQ